MVFSHEGDYASALQPQIGVGGNKDRIGAFARNGAKPHLYVPLDLYRTNGDAQCFGHCLSVLDADYGVENSRPERGS